MTAPASIGDVVLEEGFPCTEDLLAPVFEVYLGPPLGPPSQCEPTLLVDDVAREDVARSLERRIRSGELVPLAGPWATAGKEGEPPWTRDVLSVELEESIEDRFPVTTVTFTVHNVYNDEEQRYRYTDDGVGSGPVLDYGKSVVLRLGYPAGGRSDVATVFEGVISSISASFPADGEPTVAVTAVDRRDLLRGVRHKRGRTFRGPTVEQVIADAVAAQGMRVAVTAAQLGRVERGLGRTRLQRVEHLTADQDLLTFVTDLAKRHALELEAFGDVLFVREPGDVTRAALRYEYRAGLVSFTPVLNTAGRPSKVTVVGRSALTGRAVEGTADGASLKRDGLVPPTNPMVDIIRDQGGGGERELVVTGFAADSPEEASALAAAILKRHIDQTFTASGDLVGDPRVRVRATLAIAGTGRWNGFYYVTKTHHRLGAGGYQTSFGVRRNEWIGTKPEGR